MTKIEQLTQTAATLSDEQIDGLIAHAAYLAGQPLFYSVPSDVLASIDRGLAQQARGETVPAAEAFARLQAKSARGDQPVCSASDAQFAR